MWHRYCPGATIVSGITLRNIFAPLNGLPPVEPLVEALGYAYEIAARVVILSYGPVDKPYVCKLPTELRDHFAQLAALNTVIVLSAGNGHMRGDHMALDGFSSDRHVLAVGASLLDGNSGWYSERGAIAVAAPAGDPDQNQWLLAATPDGCGAQRGITAAAAAAIAGVVALLRPGRGLPPLTPWDVLDVLASAAAYNRRRVSALEPFVRNGAGLESSTALGFGVPDAAHAVHLAANRTARWRARTVASASVVLRDTATVDMPLNGTIVWCAVIGRFFPARHACLATYPESICGRRRGRQSMCSRPWPCSPANPHSRPRWYSRPVDFCASLARGHGPWECRMCASGHLF